MAPPTYSSRQPVGDPLNWSDPDYKPAFFEAPVLRNPTPSWADPWHITSQETGTRLTCANGADLCMLKDSGYDLDAVHEQYRNPKGKTGLVGRGELGKYGPNWAADNIITRRNTKTGKIEVLLCQKKLPTPDGGYELQAAFPAGMVEDGDKTTVETLKRELIEEAAAASEHIDQLFNGPMQVVHKGHVDDWRNTDHAWIETTAVHMHASDVVGNSIRLETKDQNEIHKSQWYDIDTVHTMYASHHSWLVQVRGKLHELEKARKDATRSTHGPFVSHAQFESSPLKRAREEGEEAEEVVAERADARAVDGAEVEAEVEAEAVQLS